MAQIATQPPTFGNATFDNGFVSGLAWYASGDTPFIPPTATQIVDFIRENMLELAAEGFLDDARLVDNTGFLVGWILGKYLEVR